MDKNKAKTITNYIIKDVFGIDNPYTLEEFRNKFATDIPSAKKVTCAIPQTDIYTTSSTDEKIASQKAIEDRFGKDEWLPKKRPLENIKDILTAWQEINYRIGKKYINSTDVSKSDGVYNSSNIYNSVSIFNSKNIVFSYKIFDYNYMLASRDNSSCTLGIRMKESIFCSSGFEISWSNKVSKSIYIHDSFNVYECLFCSHLRSKKYCVANMQFEKEEYFRLKKLIVDWILL